jgi:hypothetical protein
MGLYGLLADPQVTGDEPVGEPAGDQPQYFALAVAQLVAGSAAPGADQRSGRPWRERRIALSGGSDATVRSPRSRRGRSRDGWLRWVLLPGPTSRRPPESPLSAASLQRWERWSPRVCLRHRWPCFHH